MTDIISGNYTIKKHKITRLSDGVQSFYNGPCFRVTVDDEENLDEIIEILKESYKNSEITAPKLFESKKIEKR